MTADLHLNDDDTVQVFTQQAKIFVTVQPGGRLVVGVSQESHCPDVIQFEVDGGKVLELYGPLYNGKVGE